MLRQSVLISLAAITFHLAGCAKPKPDLVKCEAIEREASAKSAMLNQAAPGFTLTDHADKPVSLQQLRGEWVILYLYPKDDMPACACDATDFTRCLLGFADIKDATFLAVTDLSPMNLRAFLAVYKVQMHMLSDREHTAMAAYGALAPGEGGSSGGIVRTTVLIDPQGVVRYHWPQVVPWGHADRVARTLAELRTGSGSQTPPRAISPSQPDGR